MASRVWLRGVGALSLVVLCTGYAADLPAPPPHRWGYTGVDALGRKHSSIAFGFSLQRDEKKLGATPMVRTSPPFTAARRATRLCSDAFALF